MTRSRMIALAFCLLCPQITEAAVTKPVTVVADFAGVKRTFFEEPIKIVGTIDQLSAIKMTRAMRFKMATDDVLVLINTPGGSVESADMLFMTLRRYAGVHKIICIGQTMVASAGFNLMSKCDERWTADMLTTYMMHDPYYRYQADASGTIGIERNQLLADYNSLKESADAYRRTNAIALGLTKEEIDTIADQGDAYFGVGELIRNGYLKGVGKVVKK